MNELKTPVEPDRHVILHDVRKLVDDTQTLLSKSAAQAGKEFAETREQATAALRQAQMHIQRLQSDGQRKARELAHQGDQYVHAHPWRSLGAASALAVGIGLAFGFMLGRR